MQEEEEEESEQEQIRRVMFETDNWEDCITEAVWFGQKIPQKKRHFGRHAKWQQDPVAAFFEDPITFDQCKDSLVKIGESYMAASA